MRAKRRAAVQRMRDRVRRFVSWWHTIWPDEQEWLEGYIRQAADTRHPCSGRCCGNPRKWHGEKTLQERRAEQPEEE